MTKKDPITALNIWNNIERTFGEQINIIYEGNNIVGLHGIDTDDVINYIESLRLKLERYQNSLEEIYGLKKYKRAGNLKIKLSYIYVMLNERDGLYKIGRSLNPYFREKTLQSEAPQVINVFTSPLTYQVNENKLHRIFLEKRIRGEWFKLTEPDLAYIKNFDFTIKESFDGEPISGN